MTTDRVKEISLSRIVAHQEVQARVAMDEETIEEYAEAMQNGDKFPPVVVFTDDGAFYWLADGFHRYHAAKQIANKWSLPAEIRSGGKREAILYAVGANASHGLRRSRQDKRNSVLKLLKDEEWSQWSDREIARRCQVSPDTVNRIRRSLSESDSENEIRSYLTRHGTVAAMNTRNIGRQRQRDEQLEENQRELEEAIQNGEVDLIDIPVRLTGGIERENASLLPRSLELPSSHLVTVGQMQFECPTPMEDGCTCGEQPELINNFLATWENRIQDDWNHLTRESKRVVLDRLGLLVIQDRQDEEVAVEEGGDPEDNDIPPWSIDHLPDDELVDEDTKEFSESALEIGREDYWRHAAAEVGLTELAVLRTRDSNTIDEEEEFGNGIWASDQIPNTLFNN